jgi:hypothetical protein
MVWLRAVSLHRVEVALELGEINVNIATSERSKMIA